MLNNTPKILIISSASPIKGPGVLALDTYQALRDANVEVDLLTKYPVDNHPEFLYVINKDSILRKVMQRLQRLFFKPKSGYSFFYKKENTPPVPVRKVLSKITKSYDLVYVLFWQGLLSFKTIDAIYDNLKCKFVFSCVDYSPMSGGCHHPCSCERYQYGCGECPAFDSHDKNDFTAWNVRYRNIIYDKVKPIIWGNSYMNQIFDNSFLLKKVKKEIAFPIINIDYFKPLNRSFLMKKHKIITNRFVIFFGCQSLDDPRKGMDLLAEALKIFSHKLSEEQKKSILLIVAGKNFSKIQHLMPFESKDYGYVDANVLPELYSLADVFLCSSIHDAGPMMVDQSLCCGTPVVGFEMGSCLQVVKGCDTGYCAKIGDVNDFADGIYWIYGLSDSERFDLKNRCRNFGIEHHSYNAFSKQLLKIIEE